MKHKGLINSICKEYTLINISKCIWQIVILVLTISLNKSDKVASMTLFQSLFCDIKSCKKKQEIQIECLLMHITIEYNT